MSTSDLSHLNDVFDLMDESAFVRGMDGRLTAWNPAAERLYGWSQADALGRTVDQLLGEDASRLEPLLLSTGSWEGEVRRRTAAGTELRVKARQRLRRGPGGGAVGVLEIGCDLTPGLLDEQARRELELREASYRYVFDYMPVSLWQIDAQLLRPFYRQASELGVVDLDAWLQAHPDIFEQMFRAIRCDGVNPATVSLLGAKDPAEFVGPIDRFWRASPETLRRVMAARYSGATFHTEETRLIALDGREVDVLFVITWLGSQEGRRHSIAGLVDITERVRAQKAERRLQEEFAHSARISMLGELTASIAHEVNQPLTAIATSGAASLRWLDRETPDVGRATHQLEHIVAEARRAAEIIDRIRGMAAKQHSAKQPLEVESLIEEAAAFLQHELQAHAVRLELTAAAGLPPVDGDRTQLQQVFVNLALNAAQAMSQAGGGDRHLAIRASLEGVSTVKVTVEDRGPGLPPEGVDQLFESFFTTKAGGMGMGLAICRSILEHHGGRIEAANGPQGGAVFTIFLPASEGG
jgi:PAS domain S-box-containing protein